MARLLRAWLLRLLTAAIVVAPASAQYWTPARVDLSAIPEGNWQSCREADGQYAERIFDHVDPERSRSFEFHLGPYHEFAFFRGIHDEHRDHQSAANRLSPYNIGASGEQLSRQTWTVDGYQIEVRLAGGSREECESWWISIARAPARR